MFNLNALPINTQNKSGITCSWSSSSVGCLASAAGVWVGLWLRMSFWRPYTDCGNHQNNLQPYLHKFNSVIREEISVWLHQWLGISHGQLCDCWGELFLIGKVLDFVRLSDWWIDLSLIWYSDWLSGWFICQIQRVHNIMSGIAPLGFRRLKAEVLCKWVLLHHLSCFVRVLHSGWFLYVHFCCVHTPWLKHTHTWSI